MLGCFSDGLSSLECFSEGLSMVNCFSSGLSSVCGVFCTFCVVSSTVAILREGGTAS